LDGIPYFWWGMSFQWPAIENTFTISLPSYANIKSLEIWSENTPISILATFFNMATLEHLSILSVCGPTAPAASFFGEHTSNIRSLHLYKDNIDTSSLAMLIRSCKFLHTFHVEDSKFAQHSAADLHLIL
jgi:hypothetical protein